jgi:hypothetical protein
MKHLLIVLALVMFKSGFAFAYHTNPYVKNSYQDNGCVNQYTDTITTNNVDIKPFHLEIVAPSSGVQFYRNGIVFLAYSKDAEKMSQKHLSFGSVTPFIALVADTLLGQYMPFLPSSSFMFPAEATTFSKDFNTMYLSLIPEKDTREKIFRAAYTQNGWVIDDMPLSFCNVDYLFTHPALSSDGDFLIFSSNLKGSSGGLDLFISRKKDEEWSVPENLGGQINTTGNELFASLDADNNLYFSSDKLAGHGGYDIFVCVYDGKGWGKPQNLSKPINTEKDEVAFTLNRDNGKSAFYTSRDRSGKGGMQLYRVTLNPLITDATGQDLSKQFLAMTEIKEQSKEVNPTTPAPVAQSNPKKVEPDVETVKQDAPATVPETKKTPVVNKDTKPEPAIAPPSVGKRDVLIYRIQYAANTRPVGSQKVTIAGKTYNSYEYLYKGGYRSTIGEFSTLAEATKFINICRQSGYNQSFLVAFNNGERITDAEAKILEAQVSKTGTKEMTKTAETSSYTEIRQPAEKVNPQASPLEIKSDTKPTATSSENNEGIIYRVQILANTKPVGSYNITISGKSYKTFEYLYKGGYRTTVGDFSTFKEAGKLLNTCRQSDYPEAFIVAFKDNVRTNDSSLFK